MDLNMPIMDGMSASIELRRLGEIGQIDMKKTLIYLYTAN
jgi:CheY-like chemotaxis protein